ncbi:MAG: Bax inhibitor-1/YccA family protein [Candidatus Wallbacteria bacterium]|nr:Bax inhibitor-1/YccA family protein [Candidatus Wallbacteria bacterium]
MAKIYDWMSLGLLITALVSFFVAANPELMKTMVLSNFVWILMIAELGIVFAISGAVTRLSYSTAAALFLVYSALNGITLAPIFYIYTAGSIAATFFVTAAMFGAMAVYGHLTKADLTGMGSMMFMGLIGLIVASLVNLFLQSEGLYWIISYAGVVIFCGLTAWDVQKFKQWAGADPELSNKLSILGALALYLDFINIFLHLLRIMGRRR